MKTVIDRTTTWRLKLLPVAVFTGLTSILGVSQQASASDFEIYAQPSKGGATVMMLLDSSGSMGPISIEHDTLNDKGKKILQVKGDQNKGYQCNNNQHASDESSDGWYNVKEETKTINIYNDDGTITNPLESITVSYNYCEKGGVKYYDRMSRLKQALLPMFANPKESFINSDGNSVDFTKYKIGISEFFLDLEAYGGTSNNTGGTGGKILSPAKPIDLAHRKELLNKIKDLKALTGTPLSNAFAEAGAYMLGGTTVSASHKKNVTRYIERGHIKGYYDNYNRAYNYKFYGCNNVSTNATNPSWASNLEVYECNDNNLISEYYFRFSQKLPKTKADSTRYFNLNLLKDFNNGYGTGLFRYYLQTVNEEEVVTGGDPNSGFVFSTNTAKDTQQTKYDSPISASNSAVQCDGYGVYMLTDGQPNSSTFNTVTGLMNTSLTGSNLTIGDTTTNECQSDLVDGYYGEQGQWACTGDYAKALRNPANPKGTAIITAAVGFGSVFKSVADNEKVDKTITTVTGETKTVKVYQCDLAGSTDAKNLCKLGEKGEGYGEGGFYYTSEPSEVAASIIKFVNDVAVDVITPISTGVISAPLDVLSGGSQSRKYAYLPILDPKVGQADLWLGNLKKYKVKDATLKGGNDKLAFKNQKGELATDTYDLWNTINDTSRADTARPDNGMPQVGGTYQKIFENALVPTDIGERNLFVNSAGSLKNLKVTNNKPVNFDALSASYGQYEKRILLNFMGYSEPTTTTIADGTALTAVKNKWLKNHGGVLHSLPQLITTEVELDAAGKLKTNTRKDYILYGSMDGTLRLVDDATGKEKFTFVPKQIVDIQPDALTSVATTKSGRQPYGIDAPWLVTTNYDINGSKYKISQAFASGGMRMGGSMYYALDVTDLDTPKLIYNVGSNYANRLEQDTAALQGIKNDVMNANAEQSAFANMGQTWGKPTAVYVKSGGKRVMANILPGGYDICYEDPKFKLGSGVTTNTINDCNGKTNAQGSALYMVQVGVEDTSSNATTGTQSETFSVSSNNGKLLWWADNTGNGKDATARSSGLQYSKHADLTHSIVASARAIDRDYDGLTDIIYFADLGGQLWRADINNNKETDNFKVDRVVKILDVSDQASGNDAPPRIYERPFVTYYNGNYAYKDSSGNTGTYNGVTTLVTVGTGDRSSPVTASRSTPNAVYSIFDKDMAREDLFDYSVDTAVSNFALRTPTIKVSDTGSKLVKLTDASGQVTADVKTEIINNTAHGWYLPLDSWLGTQKTAQPYKMKMFSEPDALNGIMILSSYDPDAGTTVASCAAGIIGETQRERVCLPYGTCFDENGNAQTGTDATSRKFLRAGGGIVDNIITQFNNTSLFGALGNTPTDKNDLDVVCPSGECPVVNVCDDNGANCTPADECVGAECDAGVFSDNGKNINPLAWLER